MISEGKEGLRAGGVQTYGAVKIVIVGQPRDIRWCALVITIELTRLTDGDEWAANITLVWAEAPRRT